MFRKNCQVLKIQRILKSLWRKTSNGFVKGPHKLLCLNPWSPPGSVILEAYDLNSGSGSLRNGLEDDMSFGFRLSASRSAMMCMSCVTSSCCCRTSHSCHHDVPSNHSKNQVSSLKLLLIVVRYLDTVSRGRKVTNIDLQRETRHGSDDLIDWVLCESKLKP